MCECVVQWSKTKFGRVVLLARAVGDRGVRAHTFGVVAAVARSIKLMRKCIRSRMQHNILVIMTPRAEESSATALVAPSTVTGHLFHKLIRIARHYEGFIQCPGMTVAARPQLAATPSTTTACSRALILKAATLPTAAFAYHVFVTP